MPKKILSAVKEEIQLHPVAYAVLCFALLVGFACGAAYPSLLSEQDQQTFVQFIPQWIFSYSGDMPSLWPMLWQALFNQGKWFLILLFSGMIRFGTPFVLFSQLAKGFGMGIVFGGMWLIYRFKGFLCAILFLLPQNLLYLPATLILGVHAMTRSQRKDGPSRSLQARQRYVKQQLPCLYAILLGIVVECGIVPWIIRLMGTLYL